MANGKSKAKTKKQASERTPQGGEEITADFVRSLPKWKPMLTREQYLELEGRHVGGGNIAIDRRVTLAASARTHEQLLQAWKADMAEDGECKAMFGIIEAIERSEVCARAMLDICESAMARVLGAGIIADDEDGKGNGPLRTRGHLALVSSRD